MAPFTQVGNYVLKRKIGEGAFAEVRLAVHQETGEEYAVKVFDREALPKVHFERDIKKEIKIMQHLRHPNIVSIHAVLVTDKKLYLVMELVRGGELYDEIVSKRRVDERTSRRYFQQIVDAMAYCHRRGVVHRDLKPENLLLDGNGNVKITDFGMSWMKDNINPALKAKQLLRTQCGTPKYMAPEIIVRPAEGYDGEKLDAWECGMVLYALLAGYLPFSGEDDNMVFKSILNGKLKYPSHFSPGAKDILSRLLEKDPLKRASLSDIRQHFWFLVNYEGDAMKRNDNVYKSSSLTPSESNNVDETEKENRDPSQNKREQVTGLAGTKDYHEEQSVPHPRMSAPVEAQEHGKGRGPNSPESNATGIQSRFTTLPSRPVQAVVRGTRRKTPTPLNPNLLKDHQGAGNGSGTSDLANDSNRSREARPRALVHKPSKGKDTEVQDPVTPSQKAKPPRDSPRNFRGKADPEASKRTPRKNPPLITKLSSMVKIASSGGETVEEEEAPLSFRDRLRSPLASVLKTLRSGTGSADTDNGVESIKSSWFEASPSSVADLARRASSINGQARMSQEFSSSDENLGLGLSAAPAHVEIPMSPSAFRKMKISKVFQKKS